MSITVIVPNNDLVALAEAGDMLLRIARQKARTPDNESYIADARQAEKERVAAGLHGRVMTADEVRSLADRTPPQDIHVMPEIREAYETVIADCQCGDVPPPTSYDIHVLGKWPQAQTLEPPQMEVIDPADGLIDTVIDAGAAFSGAPLQTVNVIPPAPVENGVVSIPPTPPTGVVSIPPTPPTGVELDSRGLPWDRRIHSATRNKCKTGEWKNIKGVDKDLLASVEAELRTAMAGAGTVTQPAVTLEPTIQTVIPTVPQPVIPTVPPAPVVTPQPAVPPAPTTVPPAPAPAGCPASFPEFLQIVTGKCTARVLSYDEVTKTCQAHGLAGIPLLSARPDLIPTIYAELEALWLSRS